MPARRYPHIGQMPESDWVELRRQAGQASALLLPDLAEEVAPARCAHGADYAPALVGGATVRDRACRTWRLNCATSAAVRASLTTSLAISR